MLIPNSVPRGYSPYSPGGTACYNTSWGRMLRRAKNGKKKSEHSLTWGQQYSLAAIWQCTYECERIISFGYPYQPYIALRGFSEQAISHFLLVPFLSYCIMVAFSKQLLAAAAAVAFAQAHPLG